MPTIEVQPRSSQPTLPEPYIAAPAVAAVLGCSPAYIRLLADKGRIPYHLVGDLRRFRLSEVLAATRQGN